MLRFEDLNIKAKDTSLVKNVSFSIERGEILSLVGESGSGKSLTCLSVLSILSEQLSVSGSIFFTDRNGNTEKIDNMSNKRRKITYEN